MSVVLLNFAVWHLGVLGDFFGGTIDDVGAVLCRATWFTAPLLIAGALVYSPVRRFLLPARTWDFYGPSIAILSYVIMQWEVHLATRY